jgi:hypothetical protein
VSLGDTISYWLIIVDDLRIWWHSGATNWNKIEQLRWYKACLCSCTARAYPNLYQILIRTSIGAFLYSSFNVDDSTIGTAPSSTDSHVRWLDESMLHYGICSETTCQVHLLVRCVKNAPWFEKIKNQMGFYLILGVFRCGTAFRLPKSMCVFDATHKLYVYAKENWTALFLLSMIHLRRMHTINTTTCRWKNELWLLQFRLILGQFVPDWDGKYIL